MKIQRLFLILLTAIVISSFAGMFVVDGYVKAGTLSDNWMGVFGMVFGLATIINVIISFLYAGRLGRSALGWAMVAFIFPYFGPFILAFLSEETYKPGKGGKKKLTLSDNMLEVKQGIFKTIGFPLDSLRIVALLLPGQSKWRLLFTMGENELINLDLLKEKEDYPGAMSQPYTVKLCNL